METKGCSVPPKKGGQSTSSLPTEISSEAVGRSEGKISDPEDAVKEAGGDKEPDASCVELLQGIKTPLDIFDPKHHSFQPPTAFKPKETQRLLNVSNLPSLLTRISISCGPSSTLRLLAKFLPWSPLTLLCIWDSFYPTQR